jgi:hypothetical protein
MFCIMMVVTYCSPGDSDLSRTNVVALIVVVVVVVVVKNSFFRHPAGEAVLFFSC